MLLIRRLLISQNHHEAYIPPTCYSWSRKYCLFDRESAEWFFVPWIMQYDPWKVQSAMQLIQYAIVRGCSTLYAAIFFAAGSPNGTLILWKILHYPSKYHGLVMYAGTYRLIYWWIVFVLFSLQVMLIFFMKQNGRIIQAYHDGWNLAFHQSNLHSFSQKERAPFGLFVQ